jgi:hypothetical protein
MRSCVKGSVFAAMAVLIFPSFMSGQSAHAQGAKSETAAPVDLTGVWSRTRRAPDHSRKYTLDEVTGSLGTVPPMTAWGEARFKSAKPNRGPRAVSLTETNDPVPTCFPPGLPRIYSTGLGLPFEILQIPGRLVMLFEYDHFVRQIYTDGRQHPPDLNPTWMGDSIGRWAGDTLVVDTTGFNDKTWIDALGHPHSEALQLVERIRRISHDTITDDITMEDPKAYTKPWVARIIFDLRPDWKIEEDVCEDFLNFKDVQKISESAK